MKEEILKLYEKGNESFELIELNDKLGLKSVEELKELQKDINELIVSGKLHQTRKNKYILMSNCPSLLVGKISINKMGIGYVMVDGQKNDYRVGKEALNGALNGDIVEIDTQYGSAVVTAILERNLDNIVGEIVFKHGKPEIILEDKKRDLKIKLNYDTCDGLVDGHKVLIKITKQLNKTLYLADVIKVIGHKTDPRIDILCIAASHGIPLDFSEEVMNEVAKLPSFVKDEEKVGRKDLTEEKIFTIDGDDTKDIDDALSITKEGDNYILGIHIAHVAHYVKFQSELFKFALAKGNSSYLADTVIPMFPRQLSNGICSLNEGEDRLCVTTKVKIDSTGKILEYDIFPSVIRSKKKMTYNNVNKILKNECIPSGYEDYVDELKMLNEVAHLHRKDLIKHGYVTFGSEEAKIVQDEEGVCIGIEKRVQDEGEYLIEDCMLINNEIVASHLKNMGLPCIYRIHEKPDEEKLEDFIKFLTATGRKADFKASNFNQFTMQKLLESIKNEPDYEIISERLLRSQKKACYSAFDVGHFALGKRENYCHSTAPIRRIVDIVIQMILEEFVFKNNINNKSVSFFESQVEPISLQASNRERETQKAEREVEDMKMAEYMEEHLGEEYDGIIVDITDFGMFIKMSNLVTGLARLSELNGNYQYNEDLFAVMNNKKIEYTVGDKVRVRVMAANKNARTVDLKVVKNGNK